MVMIKCHRHGKHSVKPTDAAVLMEHYMDTLIKFAYEPPLPDVAGVSDPESLKHIVCPQADLNRIKSGKDFLGNPPKH